MILMGREDIKDTNTIVLHVESEVAISAVLRRFCASVASGPPTLNTDKHLQILNSYDSSACLIVLKQELILSQHVECVWIERHRDELICMIQQHDQR
jgi:hypothetical protein